MFQFSFDLLECELFYPEDKTAHILGWEEFSSSLFPITQTSFQQF